MKSTFPEKSKEHESSIKEIAKIIVNAAKDKIAFVILFGSFARGTWVRDRYSEDNAVYEYASDYDFLVIKKSKKKDDKEKGISDFELERKIKREIELATIVRDRHNPHFVIEPLDYVNSELEKGRYFFSDIKKEGILLYDSGEFQLSEPRILSKEEVREIAEEDYEHWFGKAEDFLLKFKTLFDVQKFNSAAFDLHQAAESLYNCALLVLTGYKPKSHDLCQLSKLASAQYNQFLTIFPTATEEQKECFKLLNKAYIDARYNKHFKITKEQLIYLVSRIDLLKEVVKEVCKDRI
jgi:HEPN domain-containing protein/predicted nucleotidyltransferase